MYSTGNEIFPLIHKIPTCGIKYREVIQLTEEIFLAVTVSIDIYLAAAAFCNDGIRIPFVSAAVINLICSAILGISTKFSLIISNIAPPELFHDLSMAVLITIGILTILKSIARITARHIAERGELSLKLGKTPLAVKLYLDDTAADKDHSMTLSAGEAVSLALASSFDCAAMGLSSGSADISPILAAVCTFVCGFAALFLGSVTGRKISSLNHDFSWTGGVMLIIFSFML